MSSSAPGRSQGACLSLVVLIAGCARERPVEAPVIAADAATVAPGRIGAAASPAPDASMVGSWEGVGTQDDGLSWPMIVKLTSIEAGACATADYPSLRCRAAWDCIGVHAGALHAEEHLLDDGATRCVDNGAMTMHLRGDGLLEWAWSAQGQSASATLRRVR
jgi:hypothetical protein